MCMERSIDALSQTIQNRFLLFILKEITQWEATWFHSQVNSSVTCFSLNNVESELNIKSPFCLKYGIRRFLYVQNETEHYVHAHLT